jgi:lipoprotein-anchoring transpeptidase ErfK/SrfK
MSPQTFVLPSLLAALVAGAVLAAPGTAQVAACSTTRAVPTSSARTTEAVAARGWLGAYRRPGTGVIAHFAPRNENGAPTVFAVLEKLVDRRCRATWYHVQLPIRPNDTTGWVRARDVWVGAVHTRIVVDLSARRLTLYRNGRAAFHTTAAIGEDGTPTPTGHYYVSQRLIAPDPGGPYGPVALGLSAFSRVLTNWPQGGPIGIHGTNEPGSIGRSASHGCIRVANSAIVTLFRATLAGTPVTIQH